MNVMDYGTFKEHIRRAVEDQLAENGDFKVEAVQISKNNQMLDGLTIRQEGQNTAPVIYLPAFYEKYKQGQKFPEVVKEFCHLYQESANVTFEEMQYDSYDEIKDQLSVRLVSKERNAGYLSGGPYRITEMGALVPHIEIPGGSIRIIHELARKYEVPERELIDAALENSSKKYPMELAGMDELLRNGMEEMEQEYPGGFPDAGEDSAVLPEDMLYVLSNPDKSYGAAVVAYPDTLRQIGNLLGNDFYVLPSSIHELIIKPKDNTLEPADLRRMVREINRDMVLPEERLSNEVFEYRREANQLSKCKIRELEMERG